MKKLLGLLLLCGCANAIPTFGKGPAHWGQVIRGPSFGTADVINPTNEPVVVDCDDMRVRIPPHTTSTVLIPYLPGYRCDLQNDDTYQNQEVK